VDRHGSRGRGWFDDPELLDADNDRVLAQLDAVEQARVEQLSGLVAVDVEQSYVRDTATSLTAWLVTRGGHRTCDAVRLVKLVRVLRKVPGLLEALQLGVCTVAHVEVLAGYATIARQEALKPFARQLVANASNLSASDYEILCAHWADLADQHAVEQPGTDNHYLNLTPSLFGESDVRGHLSADQTETLATASNTLNRPDPKDAPVQRNADALADMAAHLLNRPPSKDPDPDGDVDVASAPSTLRGSRPTAVVTLDLDTALDRTRELGFDDVGDQIDLSAIRRQLLTGGALPSEVAELFACDASVRRMIIDSAGQPLNLGRPVDSVTIAQRISLYVRDRGCVFPTCDRPAHWCDAHYLHHRADGGPTDINNLALLCRHHHRLVHGHRWSLEREPGTGVISAIRWDGLIYTRAPDGVVDVTEPADHPLRT
jgi:hypothetical protein